MTTLLQATKNDLEFYFCFIGDAWIGKQGAFSRFPCLWLYQSVRFRFNRTPRKVLAAKLANCEEFAEKLPDKWNTNIGENGCALSGGERQRISIARAFLKDAPIILLDEATASLDVENETAIQEALSRLIKKQNRPHHRPPDAHRSRCGSGGGAQRWSSSRTGIACTVAAYDETTIIEDLNLEIPAHKVSGDHWSERLRENPP